MTKFKLPEAPSSIQKGVPLKTVLNEVAIRQMGENFKIVNPDFNIEAFTQKALLGLDPLGIKDRALHIAKAMKEHLPSKYSDAIEVIRESLTPPLEETENNGLAPMFYMPHMSLIEKYGLDLEYNQGEDPYEVSMEAQYELTKRFTAEFSIRPFIIQQPERTFEILYHWMKDSDPHVRRLTTEGTRPRLPWASKIDSLVKDPAPSLLILEELKNDEVLYVRRSVANHLGDIAKDHLDLVLDTC